MNSLSRRTFLKTASAAATAIATGFPALNAEPFGLPLGLQLYSVRDQIANDYAGTLKHVSDLGYRVVESAGYYNQTAAQVNDAMKGAGLRCLSAHYSLANLQEQLEPILEFSGKLGINYIICSSPRLKDPSRIAKGDDFLAVAEAMNLEDWRWNAEQFNQIGAKVKAAGMDFGYHNHTMEFREEKGVVAFDELVRLTDPASVTFEMDCGWVAVAGKNPAEYLKRYPSRISLLHVKDFKLRKPGSVVHPPPSTELGRGTIDYHSLFAAARKGNIKQYFIEQEEFDMPAFDALKVDAEYMRNLRA